MQIQMNKLIRYIAILSMAVFSGCLPPKVYKICPMEGLEQWRKPPVGSYQYKRPRAKPIAHCDKDVCTMSKSDLKVILGNFAQCEKTRQSMLQYMDDVSTISDPDTLDVILGQEIPVSE